VAISFNKNWTTWPAMARLVRFHDCQNLARVNCGVVLPDAIKGVQNGDRVSMRWQRQDLDIAELADPLRVMPIDFKNDLLGHLQQCGAVAYGGGKVDASVLGDFTGLDDGNMDRTENAVENLLRTVRQMEVGEFHLALINGVAHRLFGLVRRAKPDGVSCSQIMVHAGAGIGSANGLNLKGDALLMKVCGPNRESLRYSHRGSRRRESANAES
jgi:hypothetical protein